jgi:plasmid replication initiation protein
MKDIATTKTKETLIQRVSQKSDVIIKSRELNEAHFPNFGLNEYRLYSIVLSKVVKFDKSDEKNFIRSFFETHIVTPKEFSEIFKVPINLCYKIGENCGYALNKKEITIKENDGNKKMNICSSVKYNTEKHHLEIKLSHEIIPHLDVTTKYVKSRLYQIANFKSVYSIELYEFIVSFKYLGKCRLSVEELNFVLGIKKIEYKHFKSDILIPSVNAINKIYPKLKLEFTEIKTGRKVTEIEFAFKKSKTKELTNNKTSLITHEAEDVKVKLVKLGVEKKVIQKYLGCSDEKLNIAYEKLIYQMKTGKVQNPTGYFIKLMDVGK